VRTPKRRPAIPSLLKFVCLLPLVGCGGGEGTPADSGGDLNLASSEGMDEGLPPSILGAAGTPSGQEINYVPGDEISTGHLAVPDGSGPFPALVIVHEWNGLVDRVRQVADDLAAEGYVTLAVDLFDGRVGSSPDENRALVSEVQSNYEKMVANMNAAVAYLRSRPDVTGRVGAMGWCFGGGIALSYGLDGDDHDATAIFYGQLVDDPNRLAALDHEVYGTFARLDQGPSPESVASFEAALRAAEIPNDLHIYDEVNHGFWLHVDQDPDVRSEPALDAWLRLVAYLDRALR
jgi:carboxymethylenebutenolidase